ncbi:hypothetical protein BDB00DRAFT_437422 [Zychaea mexicana]|uniref:uncharacterized protein n=1 Tax=Zychaea mexicana TaxID=64656 RepID=UPI0022FED1C1|nr:uncharacterized protein BDB00DRAFT_437422 [Zychaea mexicana]KAI9492377.1 hypothetical protein BDB00DRAFT_437422 [Zychaea mexicana]
MKEQGRTIHGHKHMVVWVYTTRHCFHTLREPRYTKATMELTMAQQRFFFLNTFLEPHKSKSVEKIPYPASNPPPSLPLKFRHVVLLPSVMCCHSSRTLVLSSLTTDARIFTFVSMTTMLLSPTLMFPKKKKSVNKIKYLHYCIKPEINSVIDAFQLRAYQMKGVIEREEIHPATNVRLYSTLHDRLLRKMDGVRGEVKKKEQNSFSVGRKV